MTSTFDLPAGPQVTLRDLEPDDAEAVHSFCSDPVVTQWSVWGPNTRADTQAFLREVMAEKAAAQRSRFTFAVMVGGQVTGTAGVWVTSSANRNGELGYTMHRNAWGKGLGTEVAGLLLEFAFGPLGLDRVEATCHPENTGSVRVLEKNGFKFEGYRKVAGRRRDSLLFAALRPEHRPLLLPPDGG